MKRFRPYLKYFHPVRWHFVGGLVAGLIYAAATGAGLPLAAKVVLPLIFEEDRGAEAAEDPHWLIEVIQNFFQGIGPQQLVVIACAWLPIMFFFRAAGGFLSSYLISFCGFRFLEQLRDDVFSKLQTLPVSFFQKHQAGDLLARLVGDAEMLRANISKIAIDLIKQPATLIFALCYLIGEAIKSEGTSLVLFSILSIPLCVFPLRAIARKLGKKAKHLQANAGDLSGQISEVLQSPMEIRAYNLEEHFVKRFRHRVHEILRYAMKVVKYRQMISPAVEFVAVTGLTVALYLGANKGMTLSSFMSIAVALYMCYEPVKRLGNIQSLLKQGEVAIDRLEEISLAEDSLPDPEEPQTPEKFTGEVTFEEVTFAYGEECILKGVNISVQAGECVALIGPSGGGKSTLFNLIPRFYDVTSGAVLVSGLDTRKWAKAELRKHIAIVSQTPILFRGTIRENILLGRPNATENEVYQAAKQANAHDFILKQENGYDTNVSEQGISLSGGQRQRISIARAFLKGAPIILLDEATSALDNESETMIQESLKELIKNRTTLLIAHRLRTTEIADHVVELDKGEII